jgi:hypothetical protein
LGDLWGLLLMLGFAAPLAVLVLAVILVFWRLEVRSRRQGRPPIDSEPQGYPGVVRLIAWSCGVTTLLLPWGSGIAVKLWLQSRDLPTLPWSSFLAPEAILIYIPVTFILWAFPFPLLGLYVRYRYLNRVSGSKTFKERVFVVGLSYLCGVAAGAFIFWSMFREFDILYIFVPVGVYIALPMVAGWFIARWIVCWRSRKSSRRSVASCGPDGIPPSRASSPR